MTYFLMKYFIYEILICTNKLSVIFRLIGNTAERVFGFERLILKPCYEIEPWKKQMNVT